jgi:signal transduction histidine kinase
MATFVLEFERPLEMDFAPRSHRDFEAAVLLENARRFVAVRWIIAGLFGVGGVAAALAPSWLSACAMRAPWGWLSALAVVLCCANAGLWLWLRPGRTALSLNAIRACVWGQVAVDLIVLTIVVHLAGYLNVLMGSAYLIHVTLACVFFPRRESLLVVSVAAALYVGSVLAAVNGVFQLDSVFVVPESARPVLVNVGNAAGVVVVWLTVWHLVEALASEMRQANRQLRDANERLRRAEHERDQRLVEVVHGLRSPLSGIATCVQILRLRHGDELPSGAQDVIERINDRVGTADRRIVETMFLAKLRTRPPGELTVAPVEIGPPIEAAVEAVRASAPARQIRVVNGCPDATAVYGHGPLLTALFSRLLANAVAYSEPDAPVTVSAETAATDVRVRVQDTGIGIASDLLPRVCDDYVRGKRASKMDAGGPGLGLAIVRQIARDLGLTLTLESEEGKGTTATVVLTKAQPDGGG